MEKLFSFVPTFAHENQSAFCSDTCTCLEKMRKFKKTVNKWKIWLWKVENE